MAKRLEFLLPVWTIAMVLMTPFIVHEVMTAFMYWVVGVIVILAYAFARGLAQ